MTEGSFTDGVETAGSLTEGCETVGAVAEAEGVTGACTSGTASEGVSGTGVLTDGVFTDGVATDGVSGAGGASVLWVMVPLAFPELSISVTVVEPEGEVVLSVAASEALPFKKDSISVLVEKA